MAGGARRGARLAVACWPLVRGRALDDQLLWDRIPPAGSRRPTTSTRTAGDGRAVVLPGQLYAYYDWGGTIDPILPALADKPVATRNAVGYADLHATDLLWTTDALVQQRRALPGQLDPLLDLMGARTVLDGRRRRPHPQRRRPRRGRGRRRSTSSATPTPAGATARARPRAAGTLGGPRGSRRSAPGTARRRRGLVRVEPRREPATVVRRARPRGWPAWRRFGAPPPRAARRLRRPTCRVATRLRARRAPEVVITDSNRRRVLVPSRLAQNAGPTLAADEEPSVDAAVLDPFAARQRRADRRGLRRRSRA